MKHIRRHSSHEMKFPRNKPPFTIYPTNTSPLHNLNQNTKTNPSNIRTLSSQTHYHSKMTSPHQQQSQIPSENETLIASFVDITSSTIEEARFYLESHNFDLDSAVGTFFDSPAVAPPTSADTSGDSISRSSPSAGGGSPSRSNSPLPAIDSQHNLRSRRTGDDNTNRTRSGRIRTFLDINQGGSSGDGSDSDPDRPPQYFTGGEKSGMLVQDPSKVDDVDALFKQARRMGAMEGPADAFQPSSSLRSFTGTARLLSGEVVPSASQEHPPGSVTHTITFWRNGFTVDDGPLRRFQDPENAAFLESIKRSECPEELQPADRRTSVNVNLVRKDQNCPEPKKHKVAFQGVARTLGNSSSSTPSGPTIDSTTLLNTAPAPVMGLVVDQNSPTTSIQLRLADGTRMVSPFNYHHTIRDIHAFINASRPGSAGTYTLQTMGFPPTKLTDLEQTIDQAGLANSVIIQKF